MPLASPIECLFVSFLIFASQISCPIGLFTDTAAILNSIVSNSYYGMLKEQIDTIVHPIIVIWNNRIQNCRRIGKKIYFILFALFILF